MRNQYAEFKSLVKIKKIRKLILASLAMFFISLIFLLVFVSLLSTNIADNTILSPGDVFDWYSSSSSGASISDNFLPISFYVFIILFVLSWSLYTTGLIYMKKLDIFSKKQTFILSVLFGFGIINFFLYVKIFKEINDNISKSSDMELTVNESSYNSSETEFNDEETNSDESEEEIEESINDEEDASEEEENSSIEDSVDDLDLDVDENYVGEEITKYSAHNIIGKYPDIMDISFISRMEKEVELKELEYEKWKDELENSDHLSEDDLVKIQKLVEFKKKTASRAKEYLELLKAQASSLNKNTNLPENEVIEDVSSYDGVKNYNSINDLEKLKSSTNKESVKNSELEKLQKELDLLKESATSQNSVEETPEIDYLYSEKEKLVNKLKKIDERNEEIATELQQKIIQEQKNIAESENRAKMVLDLTSRKVQVSKEDLEILKLKNQIANTKAELEKQMLFKKYERNSAQIRERLKSLDLEISKQKSVTNSVLTINPEQIEEGEVVSQGLAREDAAPINSEDLKDEFDLKKLEIKKLNLSLELAEIEEKMSYERAKKSTDIDLKRAENQLEIANQFSEYYHSGKYDNDEESMKIKRDQSLKLELENEVLRQQLLDEKYKAISDEIEQIKNGKEVNPIVDSKVHSEENELLEVEIDNHSEADDKKEKARMAGSTSFNDYMSHSSNQMNLRYEAEIARAEAKIAEAEADVEYYKTQQMDISSLALNEINSKGSYTREEIVEMPWHEMVLLAKELNVKTHFRKRGDVTKDLLNLLNLD